MIVSVHDFPQGWNNLRKSIPSREEGRADHQLNLAEPVRLGWVEQKKSGIPGRRKGLNKGRHSETRLKRVLGIPSQKGNSQKGQK